MEAANPHVLLDHGQDGKASHSYKECFRNFNLTGGPEAHDGCNEFAAAGKDGSADALKCAACGCHRNYHRQEADPVKASDFQRIGNELRQLAKTDKRVHDRDLLESISKAFLLYAKHRESLEGAAAAAAAGDKSDADGNARDGGKQGSLVVDEEEIALAALPEQSPGDAPKKKRNRTIFTNEQRMQLEALGEKNHWQVRNMAKDEQSAAAAEIGISHESLKYWFHNSKQKKKKPSRKSA